VVAEPCDASFVIVTGREVAHLIAVSPQRACPVDKTFVTIRSIKNLVYTLVSHRETVEPQAQCSALAVDLVRNQCGPANVTRGHGKQANQGKDQPVVLRHTKQDRCASTDDAP